jgi:anti-sigma B factor antagonist
MTFEHSIIGNVHVLTPKRNLLGQEETLALRGAVQEVAERGVPKIVVDLGRIAYINSLGLGALVGMMTTCKRREGTLVVARVGERIGSMLVKMKIVLIMDTFETIEEAVAAVQETRVG